MQYNSPQEPQANRTTASPSATPGLGHPTSAIATSAREGTPAPPLFSQPRALQERLPRLLLRQCLSGVFRVGWCEARASGLASVSRPDTGASPAETLR